MVGYSLHPVVVTHYELLLEKSYLVLRHFQYVVDNIIARESHCLSSTGHRIVSNGQVPLVLALQFVLLVHGDFVSCA